MLRSRKGVAHIEFALVLPVLILMLVATMEYGFMFFRRGLVMDAGREACRQGAVVHPEDDYVSEVEDALLAELATVGVNCGELACDASVSTDGEAPKEVLICEFDVEYRSMTGMVPTPDNVTSGYIYHFEQQR